VVTFPEVDPQFGLKFDTVMSSYTVVDASVVCVNNEITFSASLAVGADAAELGAWAYLKEESRNVKNKVIFFMIRGFIDC
jgi:hypothetical protein